MYVSNLHITLIFIYLIYSKHLWTKKICWSFCTNDRSWNHFFWVLRDSRTGISAIFNRRAYRLNDFFSEFSLYQLFGHPMNFNLNQSDEKSDQPGILGLDDPFINHKYGNKIESYKNFHWNKSYWNFKNDNLGQFCPWSSKIHW